MNATQEIFLTEEGFTLRSGREETSVVFAHVTAIRAEKIDLFTIDEIRVIFDRHEQTQFEVSEECRGFSELMKCILSRFPGSDSHWFEKVAHPAFAPNPTTIWTKVPANRHSQRASRVAELKREPKPHD